MDGELFNELVQTIFRFRNASMGNYSNGNISMKEIFVLLKILEQGETNQNIFTVELQKRLSITKPAMSQLFNSLESKGFITRDIDKKDRRKVVLTLTENGQKIVEEKKKNAEKTMNEIITRFGEKNTRELIDIFNKFADTIDEIAEERKKKQVN